MAGWVTTITSSLNSTSSFVTSTRNCESTTDSSPSRWPLSQTSAQDRAGSTTSHTDFALLQALGLVKTTRVPHLSAILGLRRQPTSRQAFLPFGLRASPPPQAEAKPASAGRKRPVGSNRQGPASRNRMDLLHLACCSLCLLLRVPWCAINSWTFRPATGWGRSPLTYSARQNVGQRSLRGFAACRVRRSAA